ncbi:MAG: hypothetical protein KDD66_02370 [Bdellovibrionales bacterium]|nr:hypothetical protein [Bdellovibrionales bacterium]
MSDDTKLDDSVEPDGPDDVELGEEEVPGFFESLGALVKLFLFPEPALETLYAAFWPRFVLTLAFACVLVPLVGNFLIDDTYKYQNVFIFVNRYVELTPASFRKYYFYIVGLGLGVWVLGGGVLQKYLFKMQRVDVTMLDSIAALAYSAFPALFIIGFRHIGELLSNEERLKFFQLESLLPASRVFVPYADLVHAVLSLLLLFSVVWGVYLWAKCIELICELPFTKIAINGALMLIIPSFVITAWLTFQLSVLNSDAGVSPSLDHIRDSIEIQRERELEHEAE